MGEGEDMAVFELTLELPEITEEQEDSIVDLTDGVIATHYGVTTVTLEADGADYLSALRGVLRRLSRIQIVPRRLVMDLVSRSEIAERAGVTRQAVGNWVNGLRQAGTFPAPFVLSNGGMWLWAEVVPALRTLGISADEGLSHPTRTQLTIGSAMLAEPWVEPGMLASARSNWIFATEGAPVTSVSVAAPETARFDFSLAA